MNAAHSSSGLDANDAGATRRSRHSSLQGGATMRRDSNAAQKAVNFVPGATLVVLAKEHATGSAHSTTRATATTTSSFDEHNVVTTSSVTTTTTTATTPEERTRLLVKSALDDSPPIVACFAFCLILNVVLAGFLIGIFIMYLHFLFGYASTTTTEQPFHSTTEIDDRAEAFCNYMQRWNQKLFWLMIVMCAVGVMDLVVLCLVYAQGQDQEDYQVVMMSDSEQQQQHEHNEEQVNVVETKRVEVPCWSKVQSVLKLIIDVIFFVWILQAFWVTNYGVVVSGVDVNVTDSCPNMYMFTHVYSTIVTVLATLGLVSSCFLWSLLQCYGNKPTTPASEAAATTTS